MATQPAGGSSNSTYRKILDTKALNAALAAEDAARRARCPVEKAKRTLQSRGYVVYGEHILKPGSKRFVVGQRRMSKTAMMKLAKGLRTR